MAPHKTQVVQSVEQMALLYSSNNQKKNFYQFVLDHGKEYTGRRLPSDYRQRTPKECFKNAAELALETGLTYVEGFLFRFVPIHHAWCIDENGNVIDPTVMDPQDCEYLGVPYDLDFVLDFITKAGYYGIMFNAAGGDMFDKSPEEFLSKDVT